MTTFLPVLVSVFTALLYFVGKISLTVKLSMLSLSAGALTMSFRELIALGFSSILRAIINLDYFLFVIVSTIFLICLIRLFFTAIMARIVFMLSLFVVGLYVSFLSLMASVEQGFASKVDEMQMCLSTGHCQRDLNIIKVTYVTAGKDKQVSGIIAVSSNDAIVVYNLKRTMVLQKTSLVSHST